MVRLLTHSRIVLLLISVALPVAPLGAQVSDGTADSTLAAAEQLLDQHVEQNQIAGAVAIVFERDRKVLESAVGYQDVESEVPMEMDTMFRIASMTKPITSVAVMMLVEQGELSLETPVAEILPGFASVSVIAPVAESDANISSEPAAAQTKMTIHHLLTHTSGLTYPFFGQQPHSELMERAGVTSGLQSLDITLEEHTQRVATIPLVAQPGATWQYSLSTDVLGRVIEVVSGRPFAEFVEQEILDPLGMDDTSFVVPAGKVQRVATLYRPGEGNRIEAVGEGLQRAGDAVYSTRYHVPGQNDYRSGGAGLISTAPDYMRFLRMLLGGGELEGVRLLSEESVNRMTSNQIGDLAPGFAIHGDQFGFGFGIHSPESEMMLGASPGTYSWGGFFHTYFWVDPKAEVAAVLMTQLHPFDHLNLWGDFQQAVYRGLDETIDLGFAPGPAAGDVYREFTANQGGNFDWRVTDRRASAEGAWQFLPNPRLTIQIDHLEGATRAEAILDRWGGHLRTTDKRIRFNGNRWLRVPEMRTPPDGRAEYYYAQDNPIIPVPLSHLRNGENSFDGTCSTVDGYNWGQWGLYSLILRLYYDDGSTSAPAVEIVSPRASGEITENPVVKVATSNDVEEVVVLGHYVGEDEDGDGRFLDWHGARRQLVRGGSTEWSGHIGTDLESPFEVRWDTTWIPDQPQKSIRLMALAKSKSGLWSASDIIDGLTLTRPDQSVVMIPATQVPERFGVRVGQVRRCRWVIPDSIDLSDVSEAAISLRTWHGWDGHHQPLRINDHVLPIGGNNHHYDIDRLSVPPSALRTGDNTFEIRSDTHHHMLEVLWPGPTLLLRMAREF